MHVFVNHKTQQFRSGWQIIIYLGIFLFLLSSLSLLTSPLFPAPAAPAARSSLRSMTLMSALELAAAAGASLYCLHLFPKSGFVGLGYRLSIQGWKDLGIGLLGGLGLISLTVLAALATGKASLTTGPSSLIGLTISIRQGFTLFFLAGAFEELLFRGFPFQALGDTLPTPTTILLTSSLFAAVHWSNAHTTPLALLNTAMAGIWLGLARAKTGNLWLPTGLHVGWNFATVWIWGAPVSGKTDLFAPTLMQTTLSEPAWLTGSHYGPEGSILCTVILSLTITWMILGWKQTSSHSNSKEQDDSSA